MQKSIRERLKLTMNPRIELFHDNMLVTINYDIYLIQNKIQLFQLL
jgi:hypothetical protein